MLSPALPVALGLALLACEATPFPEVHLDRDPAAEAHDAVRERPQRPLRVGLAEMESARDTYADYAHLFRDLGRRLGLRTEIVQRRTYAELNELLEAGALDAALLCTGGYLDLQRRAPSAVEVAAIPIIDGADVYEGIIIVPASSPASSLRDLAGKRFAYTDDLSLTGRAWVVQRLVDMGGPADGFFGSIVFTHAHDRSIAAVDRGVVDGAAVNGIVLGHAMAHDPRLATRVRVIERSAAFGMTPVVVSTQTLDVAARGRLRAVLLELADDSAGQAVLRAARIDRFRVPSPGMFDSAARVLERAR